MRSILLATIILLVIVSCRRKAAEDYSYYKPYVNDSVSVAADTIIAVESKDSLAEQVIDSVAIKAVDLNDNFFIVVASYVVEEYAIAKKDELEGLGYHPQIFMINEDGWYKLAVESYQTFSETKTALERIKSQGGIFGTAVIVSKKSK